MPKGLLVYKKHLKSKHTFYTQIVDDSEKSLYEATGRLSAADVGVGVTLVFIPLPREKTSPFEFNVRRGMDGKRQLSVRTYIG